VHVIDDDTGIELIEKDWEMRVRWWTREGYDSRIDGVTLVFRDPTWHSPTGGHDIEFTAKGVRRILETKQEDGRVIKMGQMYCMEIPTKDFDERFAAYVGRDKEKLQQLKEYMTEIILFYLGTKVPDRVVKFV
jgi:hypothetical protein